jgi:hypothetical protein
MNFITVLISEDWYNVIVLPHERRLPAGSSSCKCNPCPLTASTSRGRHEHVAINDSQRPGRCVKNEAGTCTYSGTFNSNDGGQTIELSGPGDLGTWLLPGEPAYATPLGGESMIEDDIGQFLIMDINKQHYQPSGKYQTPTRRKHTMQNKVTKVVFYV